MTWAGLFCLLRGLVLAVALIRPTSIQPVVYRLQRYQLTKIPGDKACVELTHEHPQVLTHAHMDNNLKKRNELLREWRNIECKYKRRGNPVLYLYITNVLCQWHFEGRETSASIMFTCNFFFFFPPVIKVHHFWKYHRGSLGGFRACKEFLYTSSRQCLDAPILVVVWAWEREAKSLLFLLPSVDHISEKRGVMAGDISFF